MKLIRKNMTRALAILLVLTSIMWMVPSSVIASAAKKAGTIKKIKITNASKAKSMVIGSKVKLSVKVTTKGKVSKAVKYSTSKKAVATVSSKGVITAKKLGTTKITVTSKANSKKKASVTVKVVKPDMEGIAFTNGVLSFEIGETGATTIAEPVTVKLGDSDADGELHQLEILPTYYQVSDFTWTSSNPEVATVDKQGQLTIVGYGETEIRAAFGTETYATETIYVFTKVSDEVKTNGIQEVYFQSPKLTVAFDKEDFTDEDGFNIFELGESTDDNELEYKLVINPTTFKATDLKWISGNTNIATVDAEGKVTIHGFGMVSISVVYAQNPRKNATVNFLVLDENKIPDEDIDDGDDDDDDDGFDEGEEEDLDDSEDEDNDD